MIKKIFAGLFFLTILANIALANSSAAKGKEMEKLEKDQEKLRLELSDLDNQIALVSSLDVIQQQAQKLGLGPGQLTILPPAPVALAQ